MCDLRTNEARESLVLKEASHQSCASDVHIMGEPIHLLTRE